VITGKIIQVFYQITTTANFLEVYDCDKFLLSLANECNGKTTGENGVFGNRRDIDFVFQTENEAQIFKNRIYGTKFDVHTKLNKGGNLVKLPSKEEIEKQKNIIIANLC
jgi:hypothetical protein